MSVFQRTPKWLQLASFGIFGLMMGTTLVFAEGPTRVMGLEAKPLDNQVVLSLSETNHATLLSPLQDGERRLLVDIQGACISDSLDKATLINTLKSQLPDVAEVTLDEFRGETPTVRLMIKTKNPAVTGALISADGNTLVLQLLPPIESATVTKPVEKTPTAPVKPLKLSKEPKPKKAPPPPVISKQPPPPEPLPEKAIFSESAPEKEPSAEASSTPPTQNVPVTAYTPETPQPFTTPGSVEEPATSILPESAPQLPEQSGDALSEATLSAKTTHTENAQLQRKIYEADSLRLERNKLKDQIQSLHKHVDQQNAMIGYLKETQEKMLKRVPNEIEKQQILTLQNQLVELRKSYDQMKEILAGYRQEVNALEEKLKATQESNQAKAQELAYRPKVKFPDEAQSRGGLLNTLSVLTQAEINILIDAEKAFRDGKKFELQKDEKKAESQYKKALQLAPQVTEYALALGMLYMQQKQYPQAQDVFTAALQYHQDDPNLLNELGKAALLQKEDAIALGYFKKALPVGVLSNYASTLRRAGKIEEAESVYKLAIAASPKDSDLQFNLGNLYLNQKRFTDAQARFKEALTLNPGFAEAHFHLGLTFAELGKSRQAVEELGNYLMLMPKAPNRDQVETYIRDLQRVSQQTGSPG
jgi:tetratricopeptide (TPR) repeat protein